MPSPLDASAEERFEFTKKIAKDIIKRQIRIVHVLSFTQPFADIVWNYHLLGGKKNDIVWFSAGLIGVFEQAKLKNYSAEVFRD